MRYGVKNHIELAPFRVLAHQLVWQVIQKIGQTGNILISVHKRNKDMEFIWYAIAGIILVYAFGYVSNILNMMSEKIRRMEFTNRSLEDFPDDLRSFYADTINELKVLGFADYNLIQTINEGGMEFWEYVLYHDITKTYAYVDAFIPPIPGRLTSVTMNSYFPSKSGNGDSAEKMVFTVNGLMPMFMGKIPNVILTDAYALNLQDLFTHHQQEVKKYQDAVDVEPLTQIDTAEVSRQFFGHYHEYLIENNFIHATAQVDVFRISWKGVLHRLRMRKGDPRAERIYVQYQERAAEAARIGKETGQPIVPPEAEAAAFTNFRRAERISPSLLQRLIIFGITLIFSFVAFSFIFEPQTLTILIVVLIVHELGHFLVMRATGHKNLSIFFIPLFGAAAKGTKLNASIQEQMFILLAGPMPGIILSYLLFRYVDGQLGIMPQLEFRPILVKLAIFGYVLNLFNLLPLYPLDGGRIVNLSFFAMHPWIDLLLKVGALVVFAFGSLQIQDPILLMLAIAVLFLIPQNFKQAKALYSIRKQLPDTIESPLQQLTEVFETINKAGYAGYPYQQRNGYVAAVVDNWSAINTTLAERCKVLAIYIGCLAVSIYMIFSDVIK